MIAKGVFTVSTMPKSAPCPLLKRKINCMCSSVPLQRPCRKGTALARSVGLRRDRISLAHPPSSTEKPFRTDSHIYSCSGVLWHKSEQTSLSVLC